MPKVISKNKDAFFNYEVIEIFEAGLELLGWEVKSIRAGNVSLKNAFCSFKNNELFVSNMHVSLYMDVKGDETRPRKLLLHQSEIRKLRLFCQQKGQTIVATTLKWSYKGYIKLDIATAKGKTKIDKREIIKKRDEERMLKAKLKGM